MFTFLHSTKQNVSPVRQNVGTGEFPLLHSLKQTNDLDPTVSLSSQVFILLEHTFMIGDI